MTAVSVSHLTKSFGDVVALQDVTLDIRSGELFFLLGPSGCGKSTLLRIIAGLQEPTSGQIFFDGTDVTSLPTQKRNAVMCFQSYALWPHMSVADNVGFGLDVRNVSAAQRKSRIGDVLELVQMGKLADRKPNELSGGQQQRVALARALAVNPACLLLDEPLSNLDAKLRQEMRSEIKRICKTTGVTTIYVTHDQKEALAIAGRIGVMNDGKLVQVAGPAEVYHRPANRFVAEFLGQTNLLAGQVISCEGKIMRVRTRAGDIEAIEGAAKSGPEVVISIRPEMIRLREWDAEPGGSTNRLNGRVIDSTFLGESSEHVVEVKNEKFRVVCAPPMFDALEKVSVEFDAGAAVVLKPEEMPYASVK